MKEERINKVLEKMKEMGLTQMIITDPVSIAYLAVHYEDPIERFRNGSCTSLHPALQSQPHHDCKSWLPLHCPYQDFDEY